MSVKRLFFLALIAMIVCSVFVSAQDEDEDAPTPVPEGGIDAEDAADEIAASEEKDEGAAAGIRANHLFANYPDLKVPAGEQVQVLVPITNAATNTHTYDIDVIAGHLLMMDQSRFVQNFSAQAYARSVEAGETATVKYTVTPDALLTPREYAFIVVAYVRSREDNQTRMLTAYNGTVVIQDALGFDFKGTFSLIVFLAAIGGAVYYYVNNRKPARAAPAARKEKLETGTKNTSYDPEYLDKSHQAYIDATTKSRNRSASK